MQRSVTRSFHQQPAYTAKPFTQLTRTPHTHTHLTHIVEISDINTKDPEFQDALHLIQHTHNSLFLTGKAGTGKSTFVKYVCATTKKKHVVLAPTGIAAINAGGSTLHSFFKLPFYPLLPDDARFSPAHLKNFLKYNSAQIKLIRQVELIIIDEISMVRADIIDFIDRVLRAYCHNMREPFGGKQLLLVGDVFQLEPVVKADEREMLHNYYPTPYFFSARVFSQMHLVSIELRKVYRQNDRAFVAVLDHIRQNTAGAADLQLLNTRCQNLEKSEYSEKSEDTDSSKSSERIPPPTTSPSYWPPAATMWISPTSSASTPCQARNRPSRARYAANSPKACCQPSWNCT
jgi:hypothetical protein